MYTIFFYQKSKHKLNKFKLSTKRVKCYVSLSQCIFYCERREKTAQTKSTSVYICIEYFRTIFMCIVICRTEEKTANPAKNDIPISLNYIYSFYTYAKCHFLHFHITITIYNFLHGKSYYTIYKLYNIYSYHRHDFKKFLMAKKIPTLM